MVQILLLGSKVLLEVCLYHATAFLHLGNRSNETGKMMHTDVHLTAGVIS